MAEAMTMPECSVDLKGHAFTEELDNRRSDTPDFIVD